MLPILPVIVALSYFPSAAPEQVARPAAKLSASVCMIEAKRNVSRQVRLGRGETAGAGSAFRPSANAAVARPLLDRRATLAPARPARTPCVCRNRQEMGLLHRKQGDYGASRSDPG